MKIREEVNTVTGERRFKVEYYIGLRAFYTVAYKTREEAEKYIEDYRRRTSWEEVKPPRTPGLFTRIKNYFHDTI